jgi:hypothetical protein
MALVAGQLQPLGRVSGVKAIEDVRLAYGRFCGRAVLVKTSSTPSAERHRSGILPQPHLMDADPVLLGISTALGLIELERRK